MSQVNIPDAPNETPHRRTYFYVGGEYVKEGEVHYFQNQMYVEQLDPIEGPTKAYPVVFIHGLGQTGTVSNKPYSCIPPIIYKQHFLIRHYRTG